MCGIAGVAGDYDEDVLRKLGRVIAHRGPDDEGLLWSQERRVGLVHRRLAIIDLSPRGHQPMWDFRGEMAIVFNGEIYNHVELRAELETKGYSFRSHSDTEVLLALYRNEGEGMLSRLNGIFAFAIWNTVTGDLFLARDGLGVKPLYYAQTARGFIFASELKALLVDPSLDRELNLAAVGYHLTYLWCPAPHTMFQHVRKVEPGHALIVRDGRIVRYWSFYELPYDQPIERLDLEELIDKTHMTLRRAVQRQMIADVPVGAFLSGGIDSSTIVAFARELSGRNALQCFTIGYKDNRWREEGMTDDLPYAQRVAHHLGVDLHTVYVGPELTDQIENMIYYLDEPQADPAALNVWFISQLAHRHGIKVLLSGTGGDDVFTGYRRHIALAHERYWSWMPAPLRGLIGSLASRLPTSIPSLRRAGRALRYAGLDHDQRLTSYFFWTAPEQLRSIQSSALRAASAEHETNSPIAKALQHLPPNLPAINKMLFLETKYFLADHNLNYTDKMAMIEGVEVRVPFLDPDLVALAARMPVKFKQRGRTTKWILRKVMEPHLPREVLHRPKTGFGAPVRSWLRSELRVMVDDLLSSESIERRGLFDARAVRSLIAKDRLGQIDAAYSIFSLLCIELWCRRFIDRSLLC